jgi:hypothetical protein
MAALTAKYTGSEPLLTFFNLGYEVVRSFHKADLLAVRWVSGPDLVALHSDYDSLAGSG